MKLAMQRTRMRILTALLPAAALLCAGIAHAQLVPVFDHLKCYVIKDPLKVKHTLDLTPEQTQFLPEPGCRLKAPAKLFCIDVQKSNVQPTPGGPPVQGENARDYLCYIVNCPKVNKGKVLTVADQFGQRDITIKPPKLLCAPAEKVGVPQPTPTRTPDQPTPAPTPTIRPCGIDSAGQCTGECPNPNEQCVQVPGTTGCRCVLPCGNATAPECDGACPNPNEACLTGATGPCFCEPTTIPCGGIQGPPICSGSCAPGEACIATAAAGCFCN